MGSVPRGRMTIKKALYNALYVHGVYLPPFTSACLTLQSLENLRDAERYHVYYRADLALELLDGDVLIAPAELVYEFVQRYHIEVMKKPLPFETAPPADYVRPILKRVDPENKMLFRKNTCQRDYDYELVQIGRRLFRYEPPGQRAQAKIDERVNKSLRLENARIALTLRQNKLKEKFDALRESIKEEDLGNLRKRDNRPFISEVTTEYHKRMFDDVVMGSDRAAKVNFQQGQMRV